LRRKNKRNLILLVHEKRGRWFFAGCKLKQGKVLGRTFVCPSFSRGTSEGGGVGVKGKRRFLWDKPTE